MRQSFLTGWSRSPNSLKVDIKFSKFRVLSQDKLHKISESSTRCATHRCLWPIPISVEFASLINLICNDLVSFPARVVGAHNKTVVEIEVEVGGMVGSFAASSLCIQQVAILCLRSVWLVGLGTRTPCCSSAITGLTRVQRHSSRIPPCFLR